MYSLKKSLSALLGLAALVALIAAATASPTQGQGGVNGKDVNVVNTPFVNVANRVGLAIGTRVGIDPDNNTVKVDTTSPLQVQDVGNARQPFQASRHLFMHDGTSSAEVSIMDVPAGKRLVVEHATVELELPLGQRAIASLDAADYTPAVTRRHPLILTPQGTFSDKVILVASQVMNIYAVPPDDAIEIRVVRNSGEGDASGQATVHGYLVDLP